MTAFRHITVEPVDAATVIGIRVPRIVDDPVNDELRNEIAATISAATPPNIVIDLSGVQIVSSAGIAFFRDLYRAASARRAQVVLAAPLPEIRSLMRMVGLDTIFGIHDDVAAALSAF